MNYTIISPAHFKTIPWKNGKGSTVELAINPGANLDNFDWRISMADVVEDGEFSDFSGYLRNLVLIKGNAISLVHNQQSSDSLTKLLDFATFDGGNKTYAKLPSGAITDFNIITRKSLYDVKVSTSVQRAVQQLPMCDLAIVYSLTKDAQFSVSDSEQVSLPCQHLLLLDLANCNHLPRITGEHLIIACLSRASNS